MAESRSGELRRLRWSVPHADISTNEWLDKQYDISQSLRILIRESIQREGYIDVANKPVEQLPRRGRPPGGDSSSGDDAQDTQREASVPSAVAAVAAGAAAGRPPADAGEESTDRHASAPREGYTGDLSWDGPVGTPIGDDPVDADQVDMDSIFGQRD